jgi:hypothetical protein
MLCTIMFKVQGLESCFHNPAITNCEARGKPENTEPCCFGLSLRNDG